MCYALGNAMKIARFLYCFAAVPLLLLAGCGGGTSAGPAPQPTPQASLLTGNWNIVGARTTQIFPVTPRLSTTLIVTGTQITGAGNLLVPCSANTAGGGSVQFSGQVAANGSFQAASSSLSSTMVTLTGTAPTAVAPNAWSGTVTFAPGSGMPVTCAYAQSTSFTASPISAVTGTYTGALTSIANSPYLLGTAVSISVTQGAAVALVLGAQTTYQIPLTGTITVTGSACFKSGMTTRPSFASQIAGDMPVLEFAMDDGSELIAVDDYLTDTTANTIQVTALSVRGGNCSNAIASTTLTRQ